jgi:hypothetical protein
MKRIVKTNYSSKPVFIVGMNGSGTTMLLDCLNNHAELYGFVRETKLIPYFIKRLDSYGDLKLDRNFIRLFNDFRNLSFFRYTNNGSAPPIPTEWKSLPRNFASIVDSVFSYYAENAGKKRWCEKTPMYAQHIESLGQLFPAAKFIHIIRDGRACVSSFHRRWKYNPMLTMYRWKNVVREARRQSLSVGDRYFEVRFESLTERPEETMREICTFLEIPYMDELLLLSRQRTFTGSQKKQITPNRNSWDQILSPLQIMKIERIGGKLLAQLGYQTNFPKSDWDPNAILRKMMLYRDYLRRGLNELKQPKSKQWDDPKAIIMRAVKQRLTSKY